jgi:hypothetical protein
MGMAQSVGATLSEEVAKALGELAMQKVRAATLVKQHNYLIVKIK